MILWLPTSAHPRLRRVAWHHHRGLARAAGPRGRYFLERQAREKLNKHAKAGKAWPGRYLPLAVPSELELVPSPRYLAVRAMTAASLACRPPTDPRPLPGRDANRCFRAGWFREPVRAAMPVTTLRWWRAGGARPPASPDCAVTSASNRIPLGSPWHGSLTGCQRPPAPSHTQPNRPRDTWSGDTSSDMWHHPATQRNRLTVKQVYRAAEPGGELSATGMPKLAAVR